jgi:RNA polymerase sigma factor (sigma-70 family)
VDDEALGQLFQKFYPKLLLIAEKRIKPDMKDRVEAADVAGTVIRTVLRRIKENKFQFDDEESLSKQLWVITVKRLANKIRAEKTQKRGGGRTRLSLEDCFSPTMEPGPAEAAEFSELIMNISSKLDEVGQRVFELHMAGYKYHEIAEQIGYSTKTVQRKIEIIKDLMKQHFSEEE